jgi:hypothetical protein
MPDNRRDGTDSAPSGSIPNETWFLAGISLAKVVTEAKMPIEEFLTQPAIESILGNISDTSDRARMILRHRSTITNSQKVSKKTFGGVPKLWKELNPLMSYLEEWNRGLE